LGGFAGKFFSFFQKNPCESNVNYTDEPYRICNFL